MTIYVRLTPGKWVRPDQVAAITENGDGWAVLTLLSGAQITAPEISARKVLNIMIRESVKAARNTESEAEQ